MAATPIGAVGNRGRFAPLERWRLDGCSTVSGNVQERQKTRL